MNPSSSSLPLVRHDWPASAKAASVAVGAAMVALASWLEIPMIPVPMTMQTYAVLVAGTLLGWRLGAITMLVYLAAAAIGMPVLSGGGSGLDRLLGPTAGYLAGFVAAATVVGWLAQRGWACAGPGRLLAAMALGHAVVLGPGVAWLAVHLGWNKAVAAGLTPFLLGAAVKSALAAATIEMVRRVLPRHAAQNASPVA